MFSTEDKTLVDGSVWNYRNNYMHFFCEKCYWDKQEKEHYRPLSVWVRQGGVNFVYLGHSLMIVCPDCINVLEHVGTTDSYFLNLLRLRHADG